MPSTRSKSRKVPPYSVHSEKAMLWAMVTDPQATEAVRGIIGDVEDFFNADHGRLYFALIELRQTCQSADHEEVIEALTAMDHVQSDRDADRIRDLASAAASYLPAVEHAQIIADKAAMRLLIHVVCDILHEAYHNEGGYPAVLEFARAKLSELEAIKH